MPGTRRRPTSEFKNEAVKLAEESGRPLQAAAELGVHVNQPWTWRNERLAADSAQALAWRASPGASRPRSSTARPSRSGRRRGGRASSASRPSTTVGAATRRSTS
jgi:transposase-like protein